ncbi:MAG: cysteine--tRNA ligase [Candidatus Dormibacteraeota bacterium]|nr:cysteine--tRNA ligase [Candidatus Dormibacteraeota bacterium]
MRLFDTARQAVVPFEPYENRVGMYVCGITPYDSAHLGHAFAYHVYDVITRRLRADGVTVQSVRNVTDVDDDVLRVARERGVDYLTLATQELTLFDTDVRDIGILAVTSEPRATQHVPQMVRWIEQLVAEGFAYARDGWVYFDTGMLPEYGRLSRLDAATMITLSRERGADPDDPRKRHPLDFVLWQVSGPDEPHWPSPWSEGRPGWHIECSVMSTGELGVPVDIHGGGDDLIFPHHECELAQCEAAGVAPFVRHWVHVAMVRYEGEKMSKSLGNLVFVRKLVEHTSAATVRLLLAMHHFRESWSYEAHELDDAHARAETYRSATASGNALAPDAAREFKHEFLARIDDNLDTPGALRVADDTATAILRSTASGADAVAGDSVLASMLDIIGVHFTRALPESRVPSDAA